MNAGWRGMMSDGFHCCKQKKCQGIKLRSEICITLLRCEGREIMRGR